MEIITFEDETTYNNLMTWGTRVSFISAMKVISFGILTQQQPQSLQCIQSLTLSQFFD